MIVANVFLTATLGSVAETKSPGRTQTATLANSGHFNKPTEKSMKTLRYYSGHTALDQAPTPGNWDGDVFTAADGGKWIVDPSDAAQHPRTDGSGMHYLVPA